MVRVVDFGFSGPEFKSRSAVELIPGGVDSAHTMDHKYIHVGIHKDNGLLIHTCGYS